MGLRWIIIGISGVTSGGKTTLSRKLVSLLPNCSHICQDNYFLSKNSDRHVLVAEINHFNWELLTSLDMEKMLADIMALLAGDNCDEDRKTCRQILQDYRQTQGLRDDDEDEDSLLQKVVEKIRSSGTRVLIIDGFSILNYAPLCALCDIKLFLDLDREECFRRRQTRAYDPPDVPGYFDICVWPEHLKKLQELRQNVADIAYWDQGVQDRERRVLHTLNCLLDGRVRGGHQPPTS